MDFGLVTVADAANIAGARATLESARRAGFEGTARAMIVGFDLRAASGDDEMIDFLTVCRDGDAARRLAPLGWRELVSALVPRAILHALDQQSAVVYVAPSVHVLGPLDELASIAGEHLALIGRPLVSVPDDGRHPTEVDLVRAGPYSPSLVAATTDARAALEWWRDTAWAALLRSDPLPPPRLLERLGQRFGVVTPPHPERFADWYSLGGEPPTDGLRTQVGDHGLVSIDLGRRVAEHPHRLDAVQPVPHRITLSDLPTLAAAVESRPFDSIDEERPNLPDGVPFDHIMLEAYRDALRNTLDHQRDPPPNPFDDAEAFVAWLHGSDFPNSAKVSRYLRRVYLSRPDLSRAFPEVPGHDIAAFFHWAREHGRREVPIPPAFLPPTEASRPAARPSVPPGANGVNLAGFLDEALGIGEVARRIGGALNEAGVPVVTVPVRRDRVAIGESTSTGALHDVNIVCINPDSLASFALRGGRDLLADRYTIGVWFWETAQLPPSFGWAFELVDEVWCASDFVFDAVSARAHDRASVWKFPLAIVAPDIDESTPGVHLGALENRFVFLHSFDYLSVVARKNPIGVIEAYRRAFTPADETALVIKSINAKARPDDHAAVRFAARGRDDIVLTDARLDAPQNASLIAGADCIVSLHRSEGFGLNLADALALGRPVIATGYGGNLEFMADLPEWLVPYRMVDVGPGQHPYPSDARWADPDLDAAAAIMRAIRDDSPRANARAEEARRDLTERFSLVRAGGTMAQRLQSLGDDRSRRERRLLRRR